MLCSAQDVKISIRVSQQEFCYEIDDYASYTMLLQHTPRYDKMHRMQGRSIDADVTMRPKSAVEKEWEAEAKQLLKAELARQG